MPTPIPAGFRFGSVEPADAFAAFERRGLLEPSFRWQDVFQDEHARAFAVAGVLRLDVLQVFRDEIETTLREGRSLEDFRDRIRPALAAKGFLGPVEITDPATGQARTIEFNDARLRTVFDVNLRQSHAAGRWARIERTKARLPLLMYRTMHDERVRASHAAWDGVVLPVDHPWWSTHYPPNGWRCRCRAFAVDEQEVERRRARGQVIKTEAPPEQLITYVNPATGEVVPVPRGIDPGFAYNPGKQRDAALYEQMLRKALLSSPLAGAVAVAQATLDHGGLVAEATRQFVGWVDAVLAAGRPKGELRFVGTIKPQAVRALQQQGIEPATAAIAVADRDVLHALRDAKPTGVALPAALYKRLPELLARAGALLLERGDKPALLYVVDLLRDDGSVAKLVLQLDQQVRVQRTNVPLNLVRTATVMNAQALGDRTRYELLWGSL